MSISNTTVKTIYVGNGVTTGFTIPFDIIESASDETVVILRNETDPDNITETLQVEGVDYNLTGGSPPTTVTMTTAPASDEKLLVKRNTDMIQDLDLQENSQFPVESVETKLDRLTGIVQELQEELDRAPKLNETTPTGASSLSFPEPDADKVIGWNDAADALENKNVTEADHVSGPSPSVSTDNAVPRWDGASGRDIQNSSVLIDDSNNMSGIGTLNASGDITTSTDINALNLNATGDLDVDGSADILVNLDIHGDLVVDGDLTVSGTTTTINTETLDVEDANISVNVGGNQASADGVSAITVEMSDATDVTMIYDSTLPSRWKVGDVGSEDEVITSTATQSLTGKDYDGGTASNTSRLTLPKADTATLDALTRKEGTLVYDTDTSQVKFDDGSNLEAVGVGGGLGINYIDNPDAEINTDGWAAYADAAQDAPEDGTGGSPTVTWTRNTSTPLRGDANFVLTKDAANRQGEGSSYDFSIDNADLSKVLRISFDYLGLTNFAPEDVVVYIYDVTNAVVIQPVGFELDGSGLFNGEFQADSTSTSYRLILHIATTNALSWDLKVDNVIVGPRDIAKGPIVTDWVDYTPTFGAGFGSVTNIDFKSRRVGGNLEVYGKWTNGTVASNTADITMGFAGVDGNVTIDTSRVPPNGIIGSFQASLTSTTHFGVYPIAPASDLSTISFTRQTSTAGYGSGAALGSQIGASGSLSSIHVMVPILGWESNTVLSSDAGLRIIAAQGAGNAGTVLTANVTDIDFIETTDTHGAFDGTTFTAPEAGYYQVLGSITITAATTPSISLYIDGTIDRAIGVSQASSIHRGFSGTVFLDAGQALTLRQNLAVTLVNDTQFHHISINKIQSPQTIGMNEFVGARYELTSGTANSSIANAATEIIDYDSVAYDSHGSVTVGASWSFTCPVPGKYSVSPMLKYADAGTKTVAISYRLGVYLDGSLVTYVHSYTSPASSAHGITQNGTVVIDCDSGQSIDIRAEHDEGSARTLTTANNFSHVSIHRVN